MKMAAPMMVPTTKAEVIQIPIWLLLDVVIATPLQVSLGTLDPLTDIRPGLRLDGPRVSLRRRLCLPPRASRAREGTPPAPTRRKRTARRRGRRTLQRWSADFCP